MGLTPTKTIARDGDRRSRIAFFNFQDSDGNLLMVGNVPTAPKGLKQRDIVRAAPSLTTATCYWSEAGCSTTSRRQFGRH
jgi:hypothetical protein